MFLNTLQKINNFIYKLSGLNRITLNLQVYINTKRNEKDKVYTKSLNIDGFVQ